ncbi:sirtuin (silent mating type information regulation 2 homolog) 3, gene 2 L homeolog isoform X2 [Xenopus laevis]|uniref:Sirtuin (Silent mating type information regulation 2 homolog) 3, gene 2 L homeolog isoform X2 n=1 Tax=Xenopus laevis TaxID=8355 RepID=A0A8J1MHJ4_XENLA|nr:sirtuin (silent mating type information regulation 2 homolog) 3, gene 2 L homeolog isoform X2 [Xenopus laevis]
MSYPLSHFPGDVPLRKISPLSPKVSTCADQWLNARMKALATTSAFQTTVIEDQNTQEAVDSKHPLDYLSRKRENDRLSGVIKQRSPGSGIYDNLQKYDIPYPEAIFDINYFVCNPKPFFHLAKELYPGKYKPNLVHYFVRLLHDKGLLLRCYTQNIDGLERLAGIPVERIVEVHGTFSSASCSLCYTPFPANEAKELIFDGIHPCCTFCSGPVKPDIVFFGEDLPKTFTQAYQDFPKADLLIIMGTSLKIQPFASLVNIVKPSIPRLLINREKVGPFAKKRLRRRDVAELGDLCDITHTMVNGLCWEEELEKLMKSPTEQATGH